MNTPEAQHWIIIGLLALMVAVIGLAAAWSISKVNTQLEFIHSTLRDINGFVLLLASLEKAYAEVHSSEGTTTRVETPSASITVSGGTDPMQQEIP